MNLTDFEKISSQLADVATKKADIGKFLSSDAGRYLIGGGLGATAGAVLGAAQPDRAKKKRNMMYYGTLGGLGGLGLAHVLNQSNAAQAAQAAQAPKPADAAPADPGKGTVLRDPGVTPPAAKSEPARLGDEPGAPDIGYDASLSDYENWKLNKNWGNRASWSAWLPAEKYLPGGRESYNQKSYAAEQAAAKQNYEQAVAGSLKVPFPKRMSLKQMREQHMPVPVNPLKAYGSFGSPGAGPDGFNLKDPETLELIRRARSHGMGNDIPGFMKALEKEQELFRNQGGYGY